jgi:hypothetical protein
MEYPSYIITLRGKLYTHDGSRTYKPVEGAPTLKPQMFGKNEYFAATLDGNLFDLQSPDIVELEDPSVVVDRVIQGLFNGNEAEDYANDRTVILSKNRTLYYVYIDRDERLGKLTKLADNVIHCSATGGIVLASDDNGELTIVDITLDELVDNEHPSVITTTLKRRIKDIINGIIITDRGFYVVRKDGEEFKFDYVRWDKKIDDIIAVYNEVLDEELKITAFYLICDGKLYYRGMYVPFNMGRGQILPIDNPIIRDLRVPWTKLATLEYPQAVITNPLGEVYVMNGVFANKLDINPKFFSASDSKNARKVR